LDESKAEDKFTESKPMFLGAWQGLHLATDKEVVAATQDTAVNEKELTELG
jgi:2-oxoglutarate dehydrogenase E1 component